MSEAGTHYGEEIIKGYSIKLTKEFGKGYSKRNLWLMLKFYLLNEKVLHNLILEDIEFFMRELGNNFSFIGSEYKIKIGDRYNYIDILLFNIKFNAYVVVELKVTEFKVEYLSQVQKYINYIDKNVKEITNNNTIGILICKKNKFMIEYCSDKRITVREYELV